MGQGATPEKLKSIIDEVDDNGNGEIEWGEYLKIMRNFYPFKLADYEKRFYEPAKKFPEFSKEDIDVFVEAFREYDSDQSGSIDAKELDVAFKRMGQGCSAEKLQQIIDEVDDNKNGTVEWPEFLAIMRNLYAARFDDKFPNKQETKTTTPSKTPSTPPTTTKTTTPVKSTTTTPSKTPSSPQTPTKNTNNNSAPAKSSTTTSSTTSSTTPSKTPSSPTTQSKTTTTTTPAKSTTTTSSSQPPSKFGQTKPSQTTQSSSTTSPLSSHRGGQNGCASCGKTVYPIEEIRAMDQTFHKGCFRCQEEGCGILLNLKTFKGSGGKIYCVKHTPTVKPTAVPVSGNLATLNAANAPKLQKAQGIKKNERMTFAPGELKPTEGEQQ